MANTNLFYNLYSNSNNTAYSGFTCNSAVDEEDTSFDISASSSGAAGVITDSNGNTLSSIDLASIHAAGITQYTSETKILAPYSCCLLQGQEYGLARASYYFLIPKAIQEASDYEKYISCDFDIIYNNFTPYRFHVSTEVDGENSFIDLINDELENNNIEISVSLQEIEDPCGCKFEYLVFLALKEGYFYYINNLKLTIALQSDEYPDSPFSKALSGVGEMIQELIDQFKPIRLCPACIDADCSCGCQNDDPYEIDCQLYTWLLTNYNDLVDNVDKYKEALDIIKNLYLVPETEQGIEEARAEALLKDTAYSTTLLDEYDYENQLKILDIIECIKAYIIEANEYYQKMYWLVEDRSKRIPLMKYPNGAFRGIAVIPDWPVNNALDFQYRSLWVNHVKSQVKLYRPTKEGLFLPKIYGVLSNATLIYEQDSFKKLCPLFKNILSNCSMCTSIADGWQDNLNNIPEDPYRPEHSIYEDTVYMGLNCYAHKKNIIGLFRYMQYVNDNKLWNKVGQAYIIIGNEDDPQSQDKNLPQSLIIYNPNPEPIRIKYLIFS